MTAPTIEINWRPRADSLQPLAAIAFGEAVAGLRARLLKLDDDGLRKLQGVFGDAVLFVAGENLPWSDGVVYLGKDDRAPSIFLPTNLAPDVPVEVFAAAVARRFGEHLPVAIVGKTVVAVGAMRPVSREILLKVV